MTYPCLVQVLYYEATDGEVLDCKDCRVDWCRKSKDPGQWQTEDGAPTKAEYSVYCSECGAWSEYRTKYCGSCGAKMEDNDEDK